MIAEALHLIQEKEEKLNFKKVCEDLIKKKDDLDFDLEYLYLTDSILERIAILEDNVKKAKEIVKKLQKREIYDFVKEYHKHYSFEEINEK